MTPIATVNVQPPHGLSYREAMQPPTADVLAFTGAGAVIAYRSGNLAGHLALVTLDRLVLAGQPASVAAPPPAQLACPEHGPSNMRQSKYPGRPPYCAAKKEGTPSGYCRWQPKAEAAA